MAWQEYQPAHGHGKEGDISQVGGREPTPNNAQSKEEMECREWKPKGPCVFHATRVEHIPECIVELDKPEVMANA